MNFTYFFIVSLAFSLLACKKKGCTDCSATNYDANSEVEDNSCEYANTQFIGVYNVEDSILAPPSLEWHKQSYDIVLSRPSCSPYNLIISNYANKNNNTNGFVFNVECNIHNSTITINEQNVNAYKVRSSTGHFSNDSIYIDIEYENQFGEVFYGSCFGKIK